MYVGVCAGICVCNYRLCLSGGGLVSLPSWRGVRAFGEQRDVPAASPAPRAEDTVAAEVSSRLLHTHTHTPRLLLSSRHGRT